MGTRSFGDLLKEEVAIAPVVITTGTVNGLAIDTDNHFKTRFAITAGVITDGENTFKVQESDTSGGTYTDVDSSQYSGNAVFADTDDATTKFIDMYDHNKRFLRVVSTATGATTGGTFSAIAISEPNVSGV